MLAIYVTETCELYILQLFVLIVLVISYILIAEITRNNEEDKGLETEEYIRHFLTELQLFHFCWYCYQCSVVI